MNVRISGRQIDLGEALRTHVQHRLEAATDKYLTHPGGASVTFRRRGDGFDAAILVSTGTHTSLNARGDGTDAYAAFDEAVVRMAKRLRRRKRWQTARRAAAPSPDGRMKA